MANRALVEKEIKEYCELNDINDVPGFITQCMLRGFNIFKFGTSPGDNIKREKGEIVDNGSNRTYKNKENIEPVKKVTKEKSNVKKETNDKQVEIVEKEEKVASNKPVVIKKTRKIRVTNID